MVNTYTRAAFGRAEFIEAEKNVNFTLVIWERLTR